MVQYKIKSDVRRRIRSDVVHIHQREADQLRDVHGDRKFTTIMNSAISWAEVLQPTESGAAQTTRKLFNTNAQPQQQMFEGMHGNSQGRTEHVSSSVGAPLQYADSLEHHVCDQRGNLLTHYADLPPPSQSDLDLLEERAHLDERVAQMMALERMMRPFSKGQEFTPRIKESAPASSMEEPSLRTSGTGAFAADRLKVPVKMSHRRAGMQNEKIVSVSQKVCPALLFQLTWH